MGKFLRFAPARKTTCFVVLLGALACGQDEPHRNFDTCYRDLDSDGFGDPAAPMTVSTFDASADCPVGYVHEHTDCFDGNADAHPGAMNFQKTDRGDGSWDWNCDGVSEKQFPSNWSSCETVACSPLPDPPLPTPECGTPFVYTTCYRHPIRKVCKPLEQNVVQTCR